MKSSVNVIICGNEQYVRKMTSEINIVAALMGRAVPRITQETKDSNKLLELATNEKFPLFIIDKQLPSITNNWMEEDAFTVAARMRKTRGESVEQYALPTDEKSFIIIFSEVIYSRAERNDMSKFWSVNMFLEKKEDALISEIAELTIGVQVFNEEWMLPGVATRLRDRFSSRAR